MPRRSITVLCLPLLGAALLVNGQTRKQIEEQRLELLRGLDAEYATAQTYLPRSKKPLEFDADNGYWNEKGWEAMGRDDGPAARRGDLVQVTKVSIEKNDIVLELNNGFSGQKGHWYDKINVNGNGPVTDTGAPAPGGTNLLIRFSHGLDGVTSASVKKALRPVLNFNQASTTDFEFDNLPPEIKAAIKDKKAIAGMTRDQVLMSMGQPVRKTRESQDGYDTEDWIYGQPPGKVVFVTFKNSKVTKVLEDFADLGGTVATTPHAP